MEAVHPLIARTDFLKHFSDEVGIKSCQSQRFSPQGQQQLLYSHSHAYPCSRAHTPVRAGGHWRQHCLQRASSGPGACTGKAEPCREWQMSHDSSFLSLLEVLLLGLLLWFGKDEQEGRVVEFRASSNVRTSNEGSTFSLCHTSAFCPYLQWQSLTSHPKGGKMHFSLFC